MPEGHFSIRDLPLIGSHLLSPEDAGYCHRLKELPVKVLQIGEGNFLRGFADWMLHCSNKQGLFNGSVAVSQPRPSGSRNLRKLRQQEGLYTLLIRGLINGERVEQRETVSVISRTVDPYGEWDQFLELADNPDLELIVSNTTEAGLTYTPCDWSPHEPAATFPAKLTVFLYRRFMRFSGDPDKGLIHLPCELLERNGDRLREIVWLHARDWKLPQEFIEWVRSCNRFLNSLVDRIVTGFPAEEAEQLFRRWGYSDPLLTTAEPYYLWAIEGEAELDARLPLRKAGLNVHWVNDLAPYQLRKVRILNGTHTMLASIGLLHGLLEVREALEHPTWGPKFVQAVFDEIVPGVPLDRSEITHYVEETLERFRNPFIRHRLSDIAMNSLSKWKVRLLPSLKAFVTRTGQLPPLLTESLASLLRLYKPVSVTEEPAGMLLNGNLFPLRDDPELLLLIGGLWQPRVDGEEPALEMSLSCILSEAKLWGEDLTQIPGLVENVVRHWMGWEEVAG
ncbi:tagaturonate reductase [Cohnella pontilimi]|uniref:Tagaturonate reductase n=1 Tax=Cohnella pontilimi TaxID=2564100 RepID=A0A4U0FGV6_9BACL|nr:tagaturonate reductase [Cohnella pontilimi]TJY44130.1 tagaturonate reductase [Cohnella pontilimi]